MRRRHLKFVEAGWRNRPDRPLIEVFADALDAQSGEEDCLIRHL